ncbi:MAG: RluA family pseudouridine synthase [Mycoplasma sp.]|nr:RluA family pseudouridine synthase [Mycoplasma sp.]
MKIKVELEENEKERIDKYISKNSDIPRNEIKELIQLGNVLVNDETAKKQNKAVKNNDLISITDRINKEIEIKPEDIKINIVYEDDDLLVVNKETGMVVHPSFGHFNGTLVNALAFKYKDNLSDIGGNIRPGIVHRIDKDTSGLLIVAKTNKAHKILAKKLENHDIKRTYVAIVHGKLEFKLTHVNLPIGRSFKDRKKMVVREQKSKNAITHIQVLKSFNDYSLVECKLETGRTHQIRVHLSHINHPIVGDPVYGKDDAEKFGQYLHAKALEFNHPITNEKISLEIDLPNYFKEKWEKLIS